MQRQRMIERRRPRLRMSRARYVEKSNTSNTCLDQQIVAKKKSNTSGLSALLSSSSSKSGFSSMGQVGRERSSRMHDRIRGFSRETATDENEFLAMTIRLLRSNYRADDSNDSSFGSSVRFAYDGDDQKPLEDTASMENEENGFSRSRFNLLPDAVIEYILTWVTITDLKSSVRSCCLRMYQYIDVKNQWFLRMTKENGVSQPMQIPRLTMHTYLFGPTIQRKAAEAERSGSSKNVIVLSCLSIVLNTLKQQPPTIHEVIMTTCHGLHDLSNRFFTLMLQSKGMTEGNLSRAQERSMRREFFGYNEDFERDAVRTLVVSYKRFEKASKSLDHESCEAMFQPQLPVPEGESRKYPNCVVVPAMTRNAHEMSDPLTLMCRTGNHAMARRFCALLTKGIRDWPKPPLRVRRETQRCVLYYCSTLFTCGQEEDIEFVLFLIDKIFDPREVSSALVSCATMPKKYDLMNQCGALRDFHGYDMHATAQMYGKKRLPYVEAVVPACMDKMGWVIDERIRCDIESRLNDFSCWGYFDGLIDDVRKVFAPVLEK